MCVGVLCYALSSAQDILGQRIKFISINVFFSFFSEVVSTFTKESVALKNLFKNSCKRLVMVTA